MTATDDASTFERAKTLFATGLAALREGDPHAAEEKFLASLALLPNRPSTLINLSAARAALGKTAAALLTLDQALALEPKAVDAWVQRGQLLQALGRPLDALAAYDKALGIDPCCAPACSQRGGILKDLGRLGEAAACFRQALALGADPLLNGFFLASAAGTQAPSTAPRAYVEGLFDSYADDFDAHLVGDLRYEAPQNLVALLPQARRFGNALDLGCGTGLMAPVLCPRVAALDGVDMSSRMLERARARNLYRTLAHSDLSDYLTSCAQHYELVVAADVFIYVGDLAAVFKAIWAVLLPRGQFAFTLEVCTQAEGFVLLPSSRYAHSRAYVLDLAQAQGFTVLAWQTQPVRHEQDRPIPGHFVLLAKGGAAVRWGASH